MSLVILTSYFSKKSHPQAGDPHLEGVENDGRAKQNSLDYIRRWFESVEALGIEARIFHDNLNAEFVQENTTKTIKFVKVETSDYSYNDWRFFCYRNYLEENKFDQVFLTDGSDVTVVKNPTALFEEFPKTNYFLGKDSLKLHQFPYLDGHKKLGFENYILFFINQFEWYLINMGVIGAGYDDMILFLNTMCLLRMRMGNPAFNADIWTGNYIFRNVLGGKSLLIGEPVTSNFKRYEDRTDVYFIHK